LTTTMQNDNIKLRWCARMDDGEQSDVIDERRRHNAWQQHAETIYKDVLRRRRRTTTYTL